MKKIFLFMVVIVSLFTFVACSGGSIEEGHTDAEAKVDTEVDAEVNQ
ncbi:MAG: sulfurtransferase, partial [Firmicutes bacterium HGW-Firmicutes-3]